MAEASSLNHNEASSSAEEDSGSEEEVKVLPHRTTRGKRLAVSDDDPEFWQEQGWEDDPDDEEWDNNGESLSELDQFDSDFFESESEEEGDGDAKDRELLHQDRKKRKHFDYEKITRVRQKRLENSTRVWSLLENAKIGARGKKITQEMMMEEAARHEKATLKSLEERAIVELQQTTAPPPTKSNRSNSAPNAGRVAVFFSWSSEKTIPAEEMRKTAEVREMERLRGECERQLFCFTNLTKPKESSFPEMYRAMNTTEIELKRTCNAQYPEVRALYMDPITLTAYNTIEEFASLREATRGEDYHSLVSAALSLIPKAQKVVNGV